MTIHFQHLPITPKTVRILGMILIMFLFSSLTVRQTEAAPLRQTDCTLPATVTTATQLANCITAANTNGAGLDTITLGANITLSAALPQITTAIVVEGAGYFIDGADTYRIFSVSSTGNLTINQATLQNGYSGGNGGAIENVGVLTVNRSTLSNNAANFAGGGIRNAGTLTIIHSTISGNTTNITGGGGISNSGPLTVTNSTFSGNIAAGSGGAIHNNETLLTVTNSTFSGNSASSGGAIYGAYANSIINLAGNIFVAGANGANCANNLGTLNDNGYNLSDDATCTNGGFGSQTNATLNLGALADNGGSTPTHLPGAGSAAINAIPFGYVGNNNGVLMACNQTTTDQIGQSRPITSNIACTSGAVEATSTSLTIIKDASPAIGADFDFTINSAPLTSYSGTTNGKPFWTRPNEGTTCTLSADSVRYHAQAFVVDTSGTYNLSSQQVGWNGYIHLYIDGFNPLAPCANYLNGDDDALGVNSSEISHFLEAGRTYFFVTSGKISIVAGNFTNYVAGPGNMYTLYESFTLDDAVPDDSDGVNASATFAVTPGAYAVTEAGLSGWGLTGATCTGASGSVSLTGDTLSVQVSNGEAVQCTFTNETLCPASGTVTTAAELSACILLANANESPSPTADTITLGADITLTTALPQITSEITLEGANHFVDGGSSVRIFNVSSSGDFTVNQATLRNGFSTGNGGGIRNGGGTLTVTNSTFSGNSATTFGGGILNDIGGTLTVTGSTFSGNSADGGGGIYNRLSTATVSNSTFSGNSAGAYGGGIYSTGGSLTVTNSTVSGNTASIAGGGIYNNGNLTLTNSTVSGNSATNYGGGINFGSGTLTVINSTISGNTANYGGGIRNEGGTLTATNSTFSDNEATISGGGMYNSGTMYLAGTIFANSTSGGNCVNNGGTLTDNGYNLSDDASCGFSGTSANNATLNLSALSVTTTPGQQVHTPQAGSDAIGAIPYGTTINNNGVTLACNQTTTDQLGADRPITALTACTAGAVEVEMPPICPAWTVTTAAELSDCITLANNNESPSPTADTITLGADINLSAALPQITSEITLQGANHFLDGGNNVRIFNVGTTGTFYVNQATLQNGSAIVGGGINNSGTLTVTDSTFSRNGGVGIYNDGTLTVANSTFSDNWDGSGIINNGTLTVTDSTFSNNIAEGGGGITNNGTLTVTNSTFSGNLASYDGGGIYNGLGKTATLINSTFSGNGAGDSGSGVYNRGTVYLAGTIFADRTSSNNCFNSGGTLIDNGYNLSDDASCGFSGTGSADNATLNLSALSVTTTPGQQVHTPQAGSDAIGAIPNGTTINNNGITLACNQTTTDQLGVDRPINGGDACTAGAVEVEPPLCTSWTVTTAAELATCITLANNNESPSPTADTITLGADITLTTALPQITSAITLEGAGHFIDGGDSVRIFNVNSSGDLTVNQATLQNSSANNGGGIYNNGGTVTVTDSTISGNNATFGGGIYTLGTLTVTNTTISGNSATDYGGGIYHDFGTVRVTNSTLSDNNAGLGGGGIYNNSTVMVTNSTFSGNSADQIGGGVWNRSGTLTVTNSTFSSNRANSSGGGIYHDTGTATVTNSTFSGNTANSGGGISNRFTLHLAGNLFAAGDRGVNCVNGSGGTLTDNGYNLSDDASCGFSGTSADNATLNLGALADNGGATQTHLPGAGSDAIGAIPNGTTISNNGTSWTCDQSSTDQRGELRPINSGDGCTAGAVEVAPICTSWTVTTAAELSECITLANANESPSPTADTITLGADITLPTYLPPITSEITLEGAGYAIDGESSRIFDVNSGGDFTVNQATLQNGYANQGGGILNNGTLTVTNSTISGNLAYTFQGGGILNNGTLTVINSTISGNIATISGGIRNNGTLTVINSTFAGNSGTSLYNNSGAVYLAGTIFADNTNGNNCVNNGGTLTDNGYNLSDDASCGFSGTSADNATLNLGTLADNGGSTQTHLPGVGSDAIGAIPNGTTISNNGTSWTCDQSVTDQRGELRPINSGDGCTAGAVEVAPICTSWTVTTAAELSDCITLANANESPSPTADTITLGADITLTTALPQITTEITLEGAGYAIDGGWNGVDIPGTGSGVQIFRVALGGDFTVNQATLQNGANTIAGGIFVHNGNLTVANSTFSNNSAEDGGVIFIRIGSVTVTNSIFSNNSASSDGGAIRNNDSLTVINSTFSDNSAPDGGAISSITSLSTLTVTNSTISGNEATDFGGGIYNNGTLTVTNSTFSGNDANNGGGIYNNGTLTVSSSTFSGNSVDDFGSGIYNTGPLAVTNSTFSGNFGSRGGGIYNSAGTLAVTNSTFSGNYPGYGGGIFNDSGTANLAGNVFAASSGGDNCTNSGTLNDNGYNLSDDATCTNGGTGSATNATLNLGDLADNGGPTWTHALLPGSDAIDAIPGGSCLTATDQRGVARPQGSGCDSGAYEATVPDVSITPSSDSIAEGTNTDLTITRVGDTSAALSVNIDITLGTDTTAGDYTFSGVLSGALSGAQVVTIPAGQASVVLNVAALLDAVGAEPDNIITVDLAVGAYNIGTPGSSVVTIPANELEVTHNGDSGEGSLRQAILNANAFVTNDTIVFTTGATTITLTSGQIPVTNNGTLTIPGGGLITISGGGTQRIFNVSSGADFTLENLTLDSGAAGTGSGNPGGAINASGASVTATNVTFSNNSANDGGAIYIVGGTLTLTDCTLTGNSASGSGTTFGGAIEASGTTLILTNCTVSNNTARFSGGIYTESSTVTVTGSTFTNNSNTSNYGALTLINNGTATVTNSTFSGNSSTNGGAISVGVFSSMDVTGSTFTGNMATSGDGGAFFVSGSGGSLALINSTVSGNSAGRNGGGVHVGVAANTTIINSTISENSATSGGGVYVGGLSGSEGALTLQNSIVANSTGGGDCVLNLGTISAQNSLIEDGLGCVTSDLGGNLTGDPMLGLLQDNGGATQTMALLAGSPALDAGDNAVCAAAPVNNLDQRGVTRPFGSQCDLGAYEGGTLVCSVSGGNTYTFPEQSGVAIYVESETDLECLYVEEVPMSHPNATGAGEGQALRTGKYWRIRALQDASGTTANSYVANLTLPHDNLNNPQACKYTGGAGYGWECAADASTSSTVTRNGLTSFSDWAVGGDVGPTAVSLQSLSVTSTKQVGVWLAVLVMGLVTAVGLWRRRTGQSF